MCLTFQQRCRFCERLLLPWRLGHSDSIRANRRARRIRELGQRSVMIIGRVHTERATCDAASTAFAVLECRDRTSLASYQCLAV